jgi:protein SDA1
MMLFVAGQIMELLEKHCSVMEPELRKVLVQALILVRNRGLIQPKDLLSLFFQLFEVQDKKLRELVFSHIVSDITNMNKKQRNEKLNRSLQNFMYTVLASDSDTAAKKSLDVMVELYRRRVWSDARTVNVMAQACTSKVTKVMVTAVQFFLGVDQRIARDADDAEKEMFEDAMDVSMHLHSKKTLKKESDVKRQKRKRAKVQVFAVYYSKRLASSSVCNGSKGMPMYLHCTVLYCLLLLCFVCR